MKKKQKKLYLQQKKRYLKKIFGSFEKPRLSVFRSKKHIYAQIIDDENAITLLSSSTLEKEIKEKIDESPSAKAFLVGQMIGKKASQTAIKAIVFDRGKKAYHGRVKNLADGARQSGLIF